MRSRRGRAQSSREKKSRQRRTSRINKLQGRCTTFSSNSAFQWRKETRAAMSEKKDSIYSAIATVALSVLALPVPLLLSIPKVGKIIRTIQQLDDGTIPCRFCG